MKNDEFLYPDKNGVPIGYTGIIAAQQFPKELVVEICDWADKMKKLRAGLLSPEEVADYSLSGETVQSAILQPSTRTKGASATAAFALNAGVAQYGPGDSSLAKNESLDDMIRVLSGYGLVVLRHENYKEALAALLYSKKPLVNAGFGDYQHPMQYLKDQYTVRSHFGRLDNLKYTFVGDLHGRTVHSLAYGCTKFEGIKITLVSPEELRMPRQIVAYLKSKGVQVLETDSLAPEILEQTHVLYSTRIQKELLPVREYERLMAERTYVITPEVMEYLRVGIALHPLPRVGDIDVSVDFDKRAKYFDQSDNGVPVWMAGYLLLLKPHLFKNKLIPFDRTMI